MIKTRQCTTCQKIKPLTQFHRHYNRTDGRKHSCKECRNIYEKRAVKKLRKEIIDHYGGKCACCGETVLVFLTVDHINNDGAKHRKEIGDGHVIYRWIKRNNFPIDMFQILCYNCNVGRARNNGVCPHKELSGSSGGSSH
ncbi:MAG TPA: hypothetical protein ENI23_02860 [bacterium]|nr:hypothetical protein [bacterium]